MAICFSVCLEFGPLVQFIVIPPMYKRLHSSSLRPALVK